MIENIFGLLAGWYLILLFASVFLSAIIYRGYVLPYLGMNGLPNSVAYRRITEYRQIARAEKILRKESVSGYVVVTLLRRFEKISLRHTYKVLFAWVGLYVASFLCSILGI